ncbi:Acyl-coenzyme A thioesterase PaaI [Streptomyces sp. enrichment culture]|uniref:hydroxyphenylacetyl-CoA thioesterase PaaI n=1 Tax=Streptomyces sp. enrichment culture TaxID=1795815 RepID=UPI003F566288
MTQLTETGQGPAQRMFAADRASRGLGMELLRAGDGSAAVRMTVTADMVNGHGVAHGGYLFTLADTAFACACNSHGPVTVAAGADVVFTAPAHEGDVLLAVAEERTRFGRSGVYDVTVLRDADGRVIAEFRGRSRTVGERGTGGRGTPAGKEAS